MWKKIFLQTSNLTNLQLFRFLQTVTISTRYVPYFWPFSAQLRYQNQTILLWGDSVCQETICLPYSRHMYIYQSQIMKVYRRPWYKCNAKETFHSAGRILSLLIYFLETLQAKQVDHSWFPAFKQSKIYSKISGLTKICCIAISAQKNSSTNQIFEINLILDWLVHFWPQTPDIFQSTCKDQTISSFYSRDILI